MAAADVVLVSELLQLTTLEGITAKAIVPRQITLEGDGTVILCHNYVPPAPPPGAPSGFGAMPGGPMTTVAVDANQGRVVSRHNELTTGFMRNPGRPHINAKRGYGRQGSNAYFNDSETQHEFHLTTEEPIQGWRWLNTNTMGVLSEKVISIVEYPTAEEAARRIEERRNKPGPESQRNSPPKLEDRELCDVARELNTSDPRAFIATTANEWICVAGSTLFVQGAGSIQLYCAADNSSRLLTTEGCAPTFIDTAGATPGATVSLAFVEHTMDNSWLLTIQALGANSESPAATHHALPSPAAPQEARDPAFVGTVYVAAQRVFLVVSHEGAIHVVHREHGLLATHSVAADPFIKVTAAAAAPSAAGAATGAAETSNSPAGPVLLGVTRAGAVVRVALDEAALGRLVAERAK